MDLINSIGVDYIAIIILGITLVVFLLDKIPIALTALISSILLALFGAMDYTSIYAGLAAPVTMLVFGMLIVGYALFETGVVTVLGNLIFKSRFARSERSLIALLMLVVGSVSAFLSNTATVATFIPLIGGMVAAHPAKFSNKNIVMPLAIAATLGGTITLVGSTPQPVASGILEEYGYGTLGMFDFAPIAIPLLLIAILYFVTVGYKLQQKVFDFEDVPIVEDNGPSEGVQVTKHTYFATATIIFCIISFATGILPIGVTALIGAAIVLVTGCIDFTKTMQHLDWNTVLLIAFAQGIAAGVSESGAGDLIANWSVSMVGPQPWLLLIAAVVICMVLTNIISNTATAAMMTPIFIDIAVGAGFHPYAFVLAIAIAANASLATPIASTPVSMALVAGYRFKDYLKVGGPLTILMGIMVVVLIPLIYGFPRL